MRTRADRPKSRKTSSKESRCSIRFESAKVDSLFDVLDAVAWMTCPSCKQISQYAGIDPRTAGKLLKNGVTIGLLEAVNRELYSLLLPYPCKGTKDQKRSVVKEALVRMPLLVSVRQFLRLGERFDDALRKAATIAGIEAYDANALSPLLAWARQLGALDPNVDVADLIETASAAKQERHKTTAGKRVVFLSHSSKDKPIIRSVAADLSAHDVGVWLDEQRIRVGDSIPERIAQGLAESDFFLIALSRNSVESEWVKKELNTALMSEMSKQRVAILPIKLDDCEIPEILKDKKYADFSKSYKSGLGELLTVLQATLEGANGTG